MSKDFNHPKVVDGYDVHIRKLIPGYELIHLQVHAILKTYLSEQAHILVVGCGTGYELQYLAEQFPQWTFTAIDPALNMLNQAKYHLEQLGLIDRMNFFHADTSILNSLNQQFDAALSILVSHFVPLEFKQNYFQDIAESLKKDGLCLSYDLMKIEHDQQWITLKLLVQTIGLSEAQSQAMLDRLAQDFFLIDVVQMQDIYKQVGFKSVATFAQVLNYYGFIGFKA
ncbi:class I SAM-dependent methyltransferase [Acinetobacter sp. ANC 4648]|uniref:class I SAM-dependent methyltransferase n=1 Tax=Acinetobacter sp. ANC 4648 TaxID=1977875 RepID=UPI000A337C34|nr:class I SAM-dependent methyltransferase [Acinetobacter sp. ANC 4648]OTG80351.1 SAM-dependent methyltransferase [Acinetobacter sp. ANC 4648]